MVWQDPVFHEAVISINHWIALVIEKQLLKLFCPLNLLSYLCEVLFNVDVLLGALAIPNLKCASQERCGNESGYLHSEYLLATVGGQ